MRSSFRSPVMAIAILAILAAAFLFVSPVAPLHAQQPQAAAQSAPAPQSPTPTAPAETSRQITLPPPTMAAPVPIDAAAMALVQKSLAALGGVAIQDATLTGSVTRTVGPDTDTGTITMKALGTNQSRLDLATGGGNWSEVRGFDADGIPQGSWTGPDGAIHVLSAANGASPAAWFSPALLLARATAPGVLASYVGPESLNGTTLIHVHLVVPHDFSAAATEIPPLIRAQADHLGAFDLYFDPVTLLPAAATFALHPDNEAGVDIRVEVDFTDYRSIDGVEIPFHVQRAVNGVAELDATISSAVVNSGLQPTDFSVE